MHLLQADYISGLVDLVGPFQLHLIVQHSGQVPAPPHSQHLDVKPILQELETQEEFTVDLPRCRELVGICRKQKDLPAPEEVCGQVPQ